MIKKIYLLIFTLLVPFTLFGLEKAHAADHKLESLHIHVFIYSDGSARITEKRSAYLTEGTENYLVMGNLGKSEIQTFTVWENGNKFQYVDNWDIKASQREKYFKNGIVEKKDGYELSWGIGEYGKHNYIVEYTITNFIKQLQDSQILFWRLVNDQTNIPPEEVTVEIESEQSFSADEENIWAFGFPGTVNFHEGKVIATNSQPLTKDDYVTILVELPDGMFAAEDIIDKPFKAIKEEAFEGSDYGKEASRSGVSIFKYIKNTFIFLFIIFILYAKFKKSAPKLTKKRPKRFKRKYPGEYYRDYPYHGDFLDIYYLSYIIGASNFEKLLTSFILKWVKEERITIETTKVGIFKRDSTAIYFFNKDMRVSTLEGKLFHMMLAAAGPNDVLEESEFTKWVESNRDKLIEWEKRVVEESLQKLQDSDYITLQQKRTFFIKTDDYELTAEGQLLEKNIYLYVNYLRDFSLLNEHEASNVMIWDQVMIWAASLGLTNVVRKQFEKLYPKYEQETVYSSGAIHRTDTFSRNTSEARTPSFSSSGSGGSSSSGGGGGSSGGGSGGGTR